MGTDAFVAYRLRRYVGPVVVAHQVTGLVTDAPEGYAPAVPPLPVNDVAVNPVQATVTEEANEIVAAELNLSVETTAIVALGKVTVR